MWVLATESQNVAKYWYANEKIVVVLVCLMLDIVVQGTWVLYRVNKDKGDDCLPLLAFRRHVVNITFLKY